MRRALERTARAVVVGVEDEYGVGVIGWLCGRRLVDMSRNGSTPLEYQERSGAINRGRKLTSVMSSGFSL